jgi:GNAT superfamily N-acetyltransferase
MNLVRDVFLEFEAPEYSQQGIDGFLRFIETSAITSKMGSGELKLWGCFEQCELTGIISVRPRVMTSEKICYNHVCLLFVTKEYHLRGIARRLFEAAKKTCASSGANEITVNSSPYAVEAYRRLGFVPTDEERSMNGIRFTPMRCAL